MYQLKKGKEGFTMVEGPFKGRKFEPGKDYSEIPPGMTGSFTEIKKAAAPAKVGTDFKSVPKPAKADDNNRKAAVSMGTDEESAPAKGGGKS